MSGKNERVGAMKTATNIIWKKLERITQGKEKEIKILTRYEETTYHIQPNTAQKIMNDITRKVNKTDRKILKHDIIKELDKLITA